MTCRFYVTTTPGLENFCEIDVNKCLETVSNVSSFPGGLIFDAPISPRLFELKSVDSLSIFLMEFDEFIPNESAEDSLGFLREFPLRSRDDECGNDKVLAAIEARARLLSLSWQDNDYAFRVTCSRQGKHGYSSPEAAGSLGYGLGLVFPSWRVDLKTYDLEFLLDIRDCRGIVALCVKQDTSRRNRDVATGEIITALNPSTAYLLCMASDIRPYMTVCDPMSGIGTIPIEGALAYPTCLFIGGDVNLTSVEQASRNWQFALRQQQQQARESAVGVCAGHVDFMCWDGQHLPLSDGSVDVFICDLPFGMKHGSYRVNRKMFPAFFAEMDRVLVSEGKALLLTIESKLVRRVLDGEGSGKKRRGGTGVDRGQKGGERGPGHNLYEYSSCIVNIGGYVARLFDIRKKQCAGDIHPP